MENSNNRRSLFERKKNVVENLFCKKDHNIVGDENPLRQTTVHRSAPPKPKRTFVQVEYDRSKALLRYNEASVANKAGNDVSTCHSQIRRPKYFQLSHEYEQIYASLDHGGAPRIEQRRSLSYEQLYSVPCSSTNNDDTSPSGSAFNKPKSSLYYCVSEISSNLPQFQVPKPKPRISKRLFKSPRSNDPSHQTGGDYRSIESPLLSVDSPDDAPLRQPIHNQLLQDEDDTISMNSSVGDADQRATRAKTMRRKTLMHYDQQEISFKCRKIPQLFEIVVVIELQPNDRSNPLFTGKFLPTLCYKFPYNEKSCPPVDPALLASLPCLCYPDVNRAAPKLPSDHEDEHFVLTLTDKWGDRKFAYCCRFVPVQQASQCFGDSTAHQKGTSNNEILPSLPQVICIVTPVHAIQFYYDFTRECITCLKMSSKILTNFLIASFRLLMPRYGQKLLIKFPVDQRREKHVQLINRTGIVRCCGLRHLLQRLNVQNLLIMFASLLSERRVLIIGDCVTSVTKIVQAAVAMLAPFEWPHTLIPVVPDSYVQLCFSPTPYLIGVLRCNLHELRQLLVTDNNLDNEEYILIYDLDYGIVKERDFNGRSISDNIALPSTHDCYRFLPSRIVKHLKHNLKSAYSTKDVNNNSIWPRGSSKKGISPTSDVGLDMQISDAFLCCFAQLLGNYRDYIVRQQDGKYTFLKEQYLRSQHANTTRSLRAFLKWFVETGIFQIWMKRRLDAFAASATSVSNKRSTNEDDILDAKISSNLKRNYGFGKQDQGHGSRHLFGLIAKRLNVLVAKTKAYD